MSAQETASCDQPASALSLSFRWTPVGKQLQAQICIERGEHTLDIDTVDLGKATKRREYAERVGTLAGVPVDGVEAELLRIATERAEPEPSSSEESIADDLVERAKAALANTDREVIEEAEAMLRSPTLVEEIGRDLEAIGVAGEAALRLTLYLLGTSRLLGKPLAAIVQGQSSSGKSYVVERVASLFPPEAIVTATTMTPQALYHAEQGSLSHRWVVVGERSRLTNDDQAEATRALREMLAAGRLSKFMPVKVGNDIVTTLIEQPGPIAYVESTTNTRVFEEDAARCVLLSTDERSSQTKTILRQIARQAKGEIRSECDRIIDRHRTLQRLLERREIVIPYADRISAAMELFADRCHLRRAFPMVLSFIRASTLLHQRRRGTDAEGRLIAEPLDYLITVRLLTSPLDNMIGGSLSKPAERFLDHILDAINRPTKGLPVPFTNDQIRLHIPHLGRSTVGNHLAELEEKGYLEATEQPAVGRGRPPKAYRPTNRDVRADGVLPTLEQLFGDIGAGEQEMPEIPKNAVSTPF